MRASRKLAVVAALAGAAVVVPATASQAAPIDCPSGHESVKTADGWDCYNPSDKPTNSEDPKNPNVKKGFF